MNAVKIISIYFMLLITNVSFSQSDSLAGQEVTIHLHKTNKIVTGKFKSYLNNRVTVLFDNSLHDYFYPEVKLLKFEGFSLRFEKDGGIVKETNPLTSIPKGFINGFKKETGDQEPNELNNAPNKRYLNYLLPGQNHLILQNKSNARVLVMNLDKKIKVRLKNYDVVKSKSVEILNDSTLKFNARNFKSYQLVSIDDVIQVKGYKIQPDAVTAVGQASTVVGIVTIPYLVGVPIIIASKYVKGFQSRYLYRWSLKVL